MRPSTRSALLRYRVMAFVVGTGLLILCATMVLKYVPSIDNPGPVQVWGPIHGFLFMVYVLVTVDLGFRLRWSIVRILLVSFAGTIPFVSFWAEHEVVTQVRAQHPDPVTTSSG